MQNYELISQIGKGSYGKVYTARNYVDHELYVLKRIPFDSASKMDADAAVREAQVLGILRHPHIVPYKEFFNHEGDLCLVMAHCEGGDLFHHVKNLRKAGKVVDEDLAWQWLVQLLLALSYCHSKKILHRDVKTQNVFLTKEGKLMLGDFGLAKQLQRTLEMARTPIGTPYYMAPEIYEEAPYSYKSDVWALGCVMYEALTGKPAFGAENLSRVVLRVLKGTYDPLPDTYSDSLREVVGAMLQKEVKKRPNVNDLLQHPRVLSKVQAYLDELSAAGAQAGWSTWRMKLPPGLIVQMANIIAESQKVPAHKAEADHHTGAHMSEVDVLRVQFSGISASRQKGGGGGGAAAAAAARNQLQLMEEQYESDFESEEDSDGAGPASPPAGARPAAQLLGIARPAGAGAGAGPGNLTLRSQGKALGGPGDVGLLAAELPKAGLGFGKASVAPAGAALAGAKRTSSGGDRLSPIGGDRLSPTSSDRASPTGSDRASPTGLGASLKQLQLAPLGKAAYNAPVAGGGTAAGGFSFQPLPDKGGAAPIPGWRPTKLLASQSINLQQALTNRGAFLNRELELQLGVAGLKAACAAVRALHAKAKSGDEPVKDAALRGALAGAVSPAHLELAPLLDELVLLQGKGYAKQ